MQIADEPEEYYGVCGTAVTIYRGAKQRIAGTGTTTSTKATREHKQYKIQGRTTNLCT